MDRIDTEKNSGLKKCKHCKQLLPIDDFYVCSGKIKANCKSCHRWFVARWQRRNPDKVKEIKKNARARDKQISTPDDSIRSEHTRTLVKVKRKTPKAKRCDKDVHASDWLSNPLRSEILSRWIGVPGY